MDGVDILSNNYTFVMSYFEDLYHDKKLKVIGFQRKPTAEVNYEIKLF